MEKAETSLCTSHQSYGFLEGIIHFQKCFCARYSILIILLMLPQCICQMCLQCINKNSVPVSNQYNNVSIKPMQRAGRAVIQEPVRVTQSHRPQYHRTAAPESQEKKSAVAVNVKDVLEILSRTKREYGRVKYFRFVDLWQK